MCISKALCLWEEHGMVIDKKKEIFWLRIYKFIACIGICSLMIEFELIFFSSLILSVLVTPIIFAEGYFIQMLFLGKKMRQKMKNDDVEFSYEMSKKRLPLYSVVPAMFVSILLAMSQGYLLSKAFELSNLDMFILPFVYILPSAVGCFTVRFRFNQLLSIRNLIELFACFLLFILFSKAFIVSLICLAVFLFCTIILMNQEGILKASYISTTCQVTDRVRYAGIWTVLKTLYFSILMIIPHICFLSLFSTPFQIVIYGRTEFPFPGMYVLNLIVYFFAIISSLVTLFLVATKNSANTRALVQKVKMLSDDFEKFIIHAFDILKSAFFKEARELREQEEENKLRREKIHDDERKFQYYVDVESPVVINRNGKIDKYQSFLREMKTKPNNNCKYCFAYRTLIDDLCSKDTGIKYYHTPEEVRKIARKNGILSQMDRIVQIYIDIAYADNYNAVDDDLRLICSVLSDRLE